MILNENSMSEAIKKLRNHTDLTQSEFSKKYNIPIGTLRDWEQGRKEPAAYLVELLEFKIKYEKEKNL